MLPLIMKRHALFALLLTLLVSFTLPATAFGATTTKSMSTGSSLADGIKVGVGVLLGFGGDADTTMAGGFGKKDYEMEATAGATLWATFPVYRYIHIGLGLNIAAWEAEVASNYNIDRNLLVDIVALLKARVPLLNDKLELYVTVPVGVSISSPSKDFTNYTQAEDGVGAAFGLRLGVGYEFIEGFGAYVEAGWAGKHHSHELKYAGWGGNKDATVTFHQFAMNLGVSYTF